MLEKIINKIKTKKSLTADENVYLFQLYQCENNKEKRIDLKTYLYLGNFGLVVSALKKVNYPAYLHDELISFGLDGLEIAIDKYDLSKKRSFSSFAMKVILCHIYDGINQLHYPVHIPSYTYYKSKKSENNKHATMIKKFEPLSLEEVKDESYSEFNIEEYIIKKEEIEALYRAISKLKPEEKEFLFEKFFHEEKGHSYKYLAEHHNTSKTRLHRKMEEILKKVKKDMEKNEKK